MNVEIYQISFEQFERMLGLDEGREITLFMAKQASEIIVGMYAGKPLAFIGVAPTTLISSDALIWMLTTEEGSRHPILLARYGAGVIETILMKYTRLFGRCFNDKSARWLKSLGADFVSETEFEFRRA